MQEVVVGEVTGTGNAIDVSVGFLPAYVRLANPTNANVPTIEWWYGMPDGSGIKVIKKAVNEGGTASYSVGNTYVTTGGISTYRGTPAGNPVGFTIGTDADINVSGEKIRYFVARQ